MSLTFSLLVMEKKIAPDQKSMETFGNAYLEIDYPHALVDQQC